MVLGTVVTAVLLAEPVAEPDAEPEAGESDPAERPEMEKKVEYWMVLGSETRTNSKP